MEIVCGKRRSGCTTALIIESAETDTPILTANRNMAENITRMANEMGLEIPKPLVFTLNGGVGYDKDIIVDNAGVILEMALKRLGMCFRSVVVMGETTEGSVIVLDDTSRDTSE